MSMNFTIKRGANLAPLFCDNIIKKMASDSNLYAYYNYFFGKFQAID